MVVQRFDFAIYMHLFWKCATLFASETVKSWRSRCVERRIEHSEAMKKLEKKAKDCLLDVQEIVYMLFRHTLDVTNTERGRKEFEIFCEQFSDVNKLLENNTKKHCAEIRKQFVSLVCNTDFDKVANYAFAVYINNIAKQQKSSDEKDLKKNSGIVTQVVYADDWIIQSCQMIHGKVRNVISIEKERIGSDACWIRLEAHLKTDPSVRREFHLDLVSQRYGIVAPMYRMLFPVHIFKPQGWPSDSLSNTLQTKNEPYHAIEDSSDSVTSIDGFMEQSVQNRDFTSALMPAHRLYKKLASVADNPQEQVAMIANSGLKITKKVAKKYSDCVCENYSEYKMFICVNLLLNVMTTV